MARTGQQRSALPPRRRLRDAERTRALILQAAREVFILGDYHQASLSDIAARAGVTQSLIHHHFGNKKGLYVSAMGCLVSSCSWAEYSGVLRGVRPAPRGKTSKTRAKNKAGAAAF